MGGSETDIHRRRAISLYISIIFLMHGVHVRATNRRGRVHRLPAETGGRQDLTTRQGRGPGERKGREEEEEEEIVSVIDEVASLLQCCLCFVAPP